MRSLLVTAGLLVGFVPAMARADVFSFAVAGSGAGYSGTGTLTATGNADGSYTVTDIAGTGVTGLIAPGGFHGNDNLLFPASANSQVDGNGFAFTDAMGEYTFQVDVFSTPTGYEAMTLDNQGDSTELPVTFTLGAAATPEPASLLLLGTGVLGMLFVGMRRFS